MAGAEQADCRVSRHLCSTLGLAAAQTKGHTARTVLLNAQVQRELAAYGRAQEGCGGAGLMPLGSRWDFGHDRLGNVDKKGCSTDLYVCWLDQGSSADG